jgi:hypothetical protein
MCSHRGLRWQRNTFSFPFSLSIPVLVNPVVNFTGLRDTLKIAKVYFRLWLETLCLQTMACVSKLGGEDLSWMWVESSRRQGPGWNREQRRGKLPWVAILLFLSRCISFLFFFGCCHCPETWDSRFSFDHGLFTRDSPGDFQASSLQLGLCHWSLWFSSIQFLGLSSYCFPQFYSLHMAIVGLSSLWSYRQIS